MVMRMFIMAVVFIGLHSSATTASASPPDTIGYGSRAIGMGGAVAADISDWSANYYNPAGLVGAEGVNVGVSYSTILNNLQINGVDSNVENIGGFDAALVAPGRFGKFRFAFGVAVHLPDQRLSRTRSSILDRPRWELWDTRPHKLYLTANVAVRPVPWLRIGFGLIFQSPSDLKLDLRGSIDALDPEQKSRIEHQFEGDLTSIRFPQAGIQILPHKMVSIGLGWRSKYELSNQLSANAEANITGLDQPIPLRFLLETESLTAYGPHQIVTSIAVKPIEGLRVGFDLTWLQWSKHPSLVPQDDIVLEADAPPSLGLDIPEQVQGNQSQALDLSDRWVPRISVEYTMVKSAFDISFRGGYVYENTPFPTQTKLTNFVDGTRHTISLGVGLSLKKLQPTVPGELRFNGHIFHSIVPTREHIKESLVSDVGDYTAGGSQWGMGLSMDVLFK